MRFALGPFDRHASKAGLKLCGETGNPRGPRARLRLRTQVLMSGLVMALGALATPGLAQVATPPNEPPVAPLSILAFPQRDFISASGYAATDLVTVQVIH